MLSLSLYIDSIKLYIHIYIHLDIQINMYIYTHTDLETIELGFLISTYIGWDFEQFSSRAFLIHSLRAGWSLWQR